MFEDKNQNQQIAQSISEPTVMPSSSSQGPSDMFAGVDSPASAQDTSATAGAETFAPTSGDGYTFEEEEPKQWYTQKKFIIIILGVVLALIIVIFGVQFALKFFAQTVPALPAVTTPPLSVESPQGRPVQAEPQEAAPSAQIPEASAPQGTLPEGTQQETPSVVSQQTTPTQQPQAGEADTDTDGLLDSEEKAIGTDINLSDTDNDGLTDREEFRVFGTDPLKQDTDGDSYFDGAEVQNGYNPKGEGKLFTIPTE